ncbi:MAG: helix-turn-helix domain-containing protein, partial [Micromonosporaceae bacterium]
MQRWSGVETRALREARRMSIREFAEYLGVSERAVSKWEARGDQISPRPDTQAMLDTALEQAGADVHGRFKLLINSGSVSGAVEPGSSDPAASPDTDGPVLVRHPADGKTMALVAAGVSRATVMGPPVCHELGTGSGSGRGPCGDGGLPAGGGQLSGRA